MYMCIYIYIYIYNVPDVFQHAVPEGRPRAAAHNNDDSTVIIIVIVIVIVIVRCAHFKILIF